MSWIADMPADKRERLLASLRVPEVRARYSQAVEYGRGDEHFTAWLALVDQRVRRGVGVGLFDLADWNMRDAYEDGMGPREAAVEALLSDDTYSALVTDAGLA